MKKQFIYILIVIITLALIGLVIIQLYWIDNAITLKEEEFKRDVKSAMLGVVHKLEKAETLSKIKAHKKGQMLLQQRAIRFREGLSNYDTSLVVEEDGALYHIQERHTKDGYTEEYQKVVKSISSINQPDVRLGLGKVGNNMSSSLKEVSLIDEMLETLYESVNYRTILQKVNKKQLDSLLTIELLNRNINTKFHYGVFDYGGKGVIIDSLVDVMMVRQSGNFAQLFPNDVTNNPHFLSVYFPHRKGFLLKTMWVMLFTSVLLIMMIIFAFTYTIQTIFRQKKLSEIKNDFISNMTHELKTPISTISLACEALTDKGLNSSEEVKKGYINMIGQENKRLGVLVENVLKSAMWDKTDLKLKKEVFDLHQSIYEIVENITIQVENKGGKITVHPGAKEAKIHADKIHITNIIYNLLDNANKYSPESPDITVRTTNVRKGIQVEIIDKGVGIKKENLNKIFDKFYRVPRGNVHDVKGFGLGLNYVRALVKKHEGEIKVISEYGKGTTFKMYIPFEVNESN